MEQIQFGYATDVGRHRDHNEDNYSINEKHNIWLVADGMGGYSSGEIASEIAAKKIPEKIAQGKSLEHAIKETHYEIHKAVESGAGSSGMGSTVVALQLMNNFKYKISWVGDSRAYLWNGKELEQITHDHSYIQKLLDTGTINEKEARDHPQRNVITQALGSDSIKTVQVDTAINTFYKNEKILLCSDGLTGEVEDEDIARILKSETDNQKAVKKLIDTANNKGGSDNITIVLVSAPSSSPVRVKKGKTIPINSARINRKLKKDKIKKRMIFFMVIVLGFIILLSFFILLSDKDNPKTNNSGQIVKKEHQKKTLIQVIDSKQNKIMLDIKTGEKLKENVHRLGEKYIDIQNTTTENEE